MPASTSKYKSEYCQDIIKFFSRKHIKTVNKKPVANNLPFFSDYAHKIHINTDTLHEWKKVHPAFSEAYKKCKELQKTMLINLSLKGLYNAPFAIFTAKNITTMRDQKDIKLSGKVKLDALTTAEIDKELNDLEGWANKKPENKKAATIKGKDKA